MTRDDTVITSLQNERIKFIRSLEMRKVRKETGLFVVEGASLLFSAREAGCVPETLVALAGGGQENAIHGGLVAWAENAGARVLHVSEAVLGKLAGKDNPQTLMGVFAQRWGRLPDTSALPQAATWLVLEEVRDPGNLGTIVRTADAVGASGIILVGTCCDAYSREAIRATMGSIFSVPIVRADRGTFLDWLTEWPGDVVGTHLDGREDFRLAPYTEPVLLVMGSEGPGLSAELTAACTRLVRIPMAGSLDSLNLAVATALSLYHIRGRHLAMPTR